MKRLLVLIVCMVLVGGAGGVLAQDKPNEVTVRVVVDKGQDTKAPEVTKSMEVHNPYAKLEVISLIDDKTAFWAMQGGISLYDTKNFGKDTTLLIYKFKPEKLIISLNSGGGSVDAAMSVIADIKRLQKGGIKVICYASGTVASAAVPLFVTADKRIAEENTVFMVHKLKLFKYFTDEDVDQIESQKIMMNMLRENYINTIIRRSNGRLAYEVLERAMIKGKYFDVKQAMEWGLVDEVG